MNKPEIKTLGELKQSGYTSRSVKEELRANLIGALKTNPDKIFKGIQGYENSVIPHLEAAILAQHNILFLGLRGQAKTKMARLMVGLLDEWMPIIHGSELNEDPLSPISFFGIETIAKDGDDTMVEWVHRSERYSEKLATPDVSVADLIGDLDPIKAANQKLSYNDERAIHYGLIPRANRGIFVINELPDLQPRIQVSLFNILQEGDIQIRGFKVRLPLDVQFVFTANPEDYTNRGSIITPLKDRIQSQIMTHYPVSVEMAKQITRNEASISQEVLNRVEVPELVRNLIEQVSFVARDSEFIDQKSGVSARLGVSALECLIAGAEQRMLTSGDKSTSARISDILSIIPAITGKVELVYEGEQEGIVQVAHNLIRQAIRQEFLNHYPSPEKIGAKQNESPYSAIVDWFSKNEFDLSHWLSNKEYHHELARIKPLWQFIEEYNPEIIDDLKTLHAEFVLHALAEFSLISKKGYRGSFNFNDMLGAMLR